MSITALTLIILAICLAAFGIAFIALGMSNERAYWSQRDPQGDPRRDATPLAQVVKRAGHYAAGEYRAPLRVAAIGIIMIWLALASAIIGVLVEIL
ncbi:MAG: hypothetical protein ACR2JS_05210 [Candidatus Nanopelagicales bacterium]